MEKPAYYYVYILQLKISTDRFYNGFTESIENRLKDHNSGKDPHTSKFKPWKLSTKDAMPLNDDLYLK